MEVLKLNPITNNIIKYLDDWDFLSFIQALNLQNEYALRELKISKFSWPKSTLLLEGTIQYIQPEIIRQYFDSIWDLVDLNLFNETFFIDNYDLIDHNKLKQLWKKCFINDSHQVQNVKIFSDKLHDIFPTFKNLIICRGWSYYEGECYNEVETLGELCHNCRENQCPRCYYVILPKLELDNWGQCGDCAGCKPYSYYDSDY